ncbi:uncharacterized protein OCT59_025257 [Rhizophagus irregularis]|uniref:uncharacterized protein n=1 Tax=Rhizophagus irregularis TaxID=588596 RepID=UPI0033335FE2|nr:hypothetical protein OCT59_025257 [Rhizophagus irregularis]
MSFHCHACITYHKKLTLYFTSKDNKIPDQCRKKKGLNFIYGKVYRNFQRTPSSSSKVRKRQEKCFDASIRHTFRNANLRTNALLDDKLRAAQRHMLLFQETQSFTKPLTHLCYKKKFISPLQQDYSFPLSFPGTNRVSAVIATELYSNDSSIASPTIVDPNPPVVIDNLENVPKHYIPLIPDEPFYEGGLYNQPSHRNIRKRNLKLLTVGSNAWLAHMKEIYDIHIENTQYEQAKIDAGSQ